MLLLLEACGYNFWEEEPPYSVICNMGVRPFVLVYSSFVQQRVSECARDGEIKRWMVLASLSSYCDFAESFAFLGSWWLTFSYAASTLLWRGPWDLEFLFLILCASVVGPYHALLDHPGLSLTGFWISVVGQEGHCTDGISRFPSVLKMYTA